MLALANKKDKRHILSESTVWNTHSMNMKNKQQNDNNNGKKRFRRYIYIGSMCGMRACMYVPLKVQAMANDVIRSGNAERFANRMN